MDILRRLSRTACILTAACCLLPRTATGADGSMGVERVARIVSPGYQARAAQRDDETRWVQIDLGQPRHIETVKLFPAVDWGPSSIGFPVRFRVEASNDPTFASATMIADRTATDYPKPSDEVAVFKTDATGRYVRVTVTRLRDRQFALYRLRVFSAGQEVAVGCPAADSVSGSLGKIALTNPPRPQGDEVVTDNPGNVIPADQWKPVAYKAQTPVGGVTLDDGLFKSVMQNNITYLLNSFSVDEMLRQFRERAGKPIPAGLRTPDPFWDVALPGSSAGRFMMGAGNTLRWIDNEELRRRMNQIVDGITECRQPDGFIMAYPENTIFTSERAAYTRSWVTHGLIEAGYAGNAKAFDLLRSQYDWFDQCVYLPELLRRGGQGVQGMIANTRTYFTPIGKPRDLQVIQRYFQENYWLDGLAKRDPRAIWQYPYDHPHNYLITSLEPYLDLYRATGAKKYLQAAQGGWELYHDDWEHVGGSIAICEADSYPPKSYLLHLHTGELCGSTFWVRYNQRFHLLEPDVEKYVSEIEKSVYNVGMANQIGSQGIRYHANLVGKKDPMGHTPVNSCCEGQGTRLIGSMPEYLYSVAKDGLYVDLFAGSTIQWKQNGRALGLHMATQFPYDPKVEMRLSAPAPTAMKLRIRVPSWAASPMPIEVNGKVAKIGKPGSYAVLSRAWSNGDTIRFTLPMQAKLTRYAGMDQYNGQERYALEYGPILMAVVGPMDEQQGAQVKVRPANLPSRLTPINGQPLHFAIQGDEAHQYIPYWQVADEVFTCYPVIDDGTAPKAQAPLADDLALASKGADATSDSEYANEPGCTAKVIDGIVASSADFANRWHSSLDTPHPHWVQVKLPRPERIGTVVVRFADPAGHPVSFQGLVSVNGQLKPVFDVKAYGDASGYRAKIKPVVTDTFRLLIRESANPAYPNAAQVSEIELYAAGGR